MTKDEYVKTLEKVAADNAVNAKHDDYYDGYFDGLKKAIKLTKELDEPKKVVIPQFVADWIAEAKSYYINDVDSLGIVYWICNHCTDTESNYEWLKNIDNQKLLLNAIANGYEVEKESKYYVKIKCFVSSDNTLYVNRNNARGDFFLEGKKQTPSFNTTFTKSYLKSHWTGYDAYNNANLLEFEEVEDE
ncbi:DUF1642 domain-containing protein [Pediococcus pentosaceus]|uniref:DUF1642 domain-containing protein n=1 Tax=Pediococcus pentosaceus CGMCC 7049 TaxID=1460385 RepID=A0AAU7NIX1_PEDPE|nr:DUF1642 domain-containing protein [Pediococcus pentosaceus]MCV3324955.1 DUF1642 domain-containing protein [Pediococcus pentosaceus]